MIEFSTDLKLLAADVVGALARSGATIATAESCTGGLIASALTAAPGSSAAVYGGFVTYSNDAKITMLGVSPESLAEHGAVSETVAREMAAGARRTAGTTYAIAVTGIAGPAGGSAEKPVGLVHFALAAPSGVTHLRVEFGDIGRDRIRAETVERALKLVYEDLGR